MMEYLNLIAAIVSILAAGYVFAKIHMHMRMLASGSLLAFGILHIHSGPTVEVIKLMTDMGVVASIVYFATIANNFVSLQSKVSDATTDTCYKKNCDARKTEVEVKTDFPPHDYNPKDTANVGKN